MKRLTEEQDKEITKLFNELADLVSNPNSDSSEMTEEAKKYMMVNSLVSEAFTMGKYKFYEVVMYAECKLGVTLPEYLRDLKVAYAIIANSSETSDEIFNNMDDMKIVRAFKLDT